MKRRTSKWRRKMRREVQAIQTRYINSAIYQLDFESQQNRHVVGFWRSCLEAIGCTVLIAGSYVYWGDR